METLDDWIKNELAERNKNRSPDIAGYDTESSLRYSIAWDRVMLKEVAEFPIEDVFTRLLEMPVPAAFKKEYDKETPRGKQMMLKDIMANPEMIDINYIMNDTEDKASGKSEDEIVDSVMDANK